MIGPELCSFESSWAPFVAPWAIHLIMDIATDKANLPSKSLIFYHCLYSFCSYSKISPHHTNILGSHGLVKGAQQKNLYFFYSHINYIHVIFFYFMQTIVNEMKTILIVFHIHVHWLLKPGKKTIEFNLA